MVTQTDKKFDCWACRHRREVPGSSHIRCAHPSIPPSHPLAEVLTTLASARGVPFMQDSRIIGALNIRGDPHGIRNGWFNWPLEFDPTWLLNCDGYERKGHEF